MTAVATRSYDEFLRAKIVQSPRLGFDVALDDINPACRHAPFEHQGDLIRWGVRGGRRAWFASFGLGKTPIQLEACRLILEKSRQADAFGLITTPLGVRGEFLENAAMLGIPLSFVRTTDEMRAGGPGLYLTNYESVREGKIDPSILTVSSLDEASVLRGLGTKTFREFYRGFLNVPYKFVATATPAPNDYIEILNYAMYLGVMDIGEAKTRFFRRNSEKSDDLQLHPHKEEEFWLWVNTWAVFITKPSDLGYSDAAYTLPKLTINWHQVGVDHSTAGEERNGQGRLLKDAALGLAEDAAARRDSIDERIGKVRDLVKARPHDHVLIWHDLEAERGAIEDLVPGITSVYGSQDLEEREGFVADFANGRRKRLAAKPVMLGSGCNLQRHCHWAIVAGVSFKFNDLIQAIHRIYRFQQKYEVTIDIVFAESQAKVRSDLMAKWKRHDELTAKMAAIVREFGLYRLNPDELLSRSLGVDRFEASGDGWQLINNDAVEESRAAAADDVGLIVTSIPFSTQYEYTPSYNDFGHTDDKAHFFAQMDYLSPELYRCLKPGRMMCVHVKDRVRPGGYDGRSFQSIDPFHADCLTHYQRHGFVYMGMITVVTDVVRENDQTYRLGWSMQCDDGSRMGVGLPEYVLLFRKPPTDPTRGYADEPVEKTKEQYTRARWQMDAHAFWKSNGIALPEPEDFVGKPWKEIFNRFRGFTLATPYDHERVVRIADALDEAGSLPPDFMLLQPGTDHPDVWCDVMRARTLNGAQASAGREKHLCPLQFDIVDRLINRFSNAGDIVLDPFAGLGTVPLRAVELGRRGRGFELNPAYHADSVRYLRQAEERRGTPTLFDEPAEEVA